MLSHIASFAVYTVFIEWIIPSAKGIPIALIFLGGKTKGSFIAFKLDL